MNSKLSSALLIPIIIIVSFMVGIFTIIAMINFFFFPLSIKNNTTPIHKKQLQPIVQKEILYVSGKNASLDIYSYNLLTKESTDLTNSNNNDMNPQLSPNGHTIVFYSDRTGINQIYTYDLETKRVTKLTFDPADDYDPSYSPDGTKVVFKSTRSDKKGDIFIMNADGSNPQNLTPNREGTEEWDPRFSQDGQKIIFVTRANNDVTTDEIYSMNTNGSDPIRLTNNNVADWYPSANPQTGVIVYVSTSPLTHMDAIYTMDSDGTNKQMIQTMTGNNDDPSWSSDGTRIIFINQKTNDAIYNIYMAKADGSDTKEVLSTNLDKLSPIFIPQN